MPPTDCGEASAYVNDHFQGEYIPGEKPGAVLVRLLTELRAARGTAPAAAEREACAVGLDALAESEKKSEDAAEGDDHRTIARAMRKAYVRGADAIRARK